MENKAENLRIMRIATRIINTGVFFFLVVFFSIINLGLAMHFFDGAYIILSLIFFIIFLASIIVFIFLCIKYPNLDQHKPFKLNLISLIILIFTYFITKYFPFMLGGFNIVSIISLTLLISYILFITSVILFLLGHYKNRGTK